MEKKYHLVFTLAFLVGLCLAFERYTVTLAIAAFIYAVVPDLDQLSKWLAHRNLFLHSIVIWVLVWCFNPFTIFVLFSGVVGLHCLCDIRWHKKQQTGFYTIKLYEKVGLNGTWSTVWLAVNGLAGIAFVIVWGFL